MCLLIHRCHKSVTVKNIIIKMVFISGKTKVKKKKVVCLIRSENNRIEYQLSFRFRTFVNCYYSR